MKLFTIHQNHKISLSIWDRILVLFGRKVSLHSTIWVDKEVTVTDQMSITFVEPLFSNKKKGLEETK